MLTGSAPLAFRRRDDRVDGRRPDAEHFADAVLGPAGGPGLHDGCLPLADRLAKLLRCIPCPEQLLHDDRITGRQRDFRLVVERLLSQDRSSFGIVRFLVRVIPGDHLVVDLRPPRLHFGVLLESQLEVLADPHVEQHVAGTKTAVEGRLALHLAPCGSGRFGASSMSPTYQRANRRISAERFRSGSERLAAASSRSHRSSSSRIRRKRVAFLGMVSAFLSALLWSTGNPLTSLACRHSIDYSRGHD